MTHTYLGWLFGLEGDPAVSLTAPGLTLRAMSAEEADRIMRCSTGFFALKAPEARELCSRPGDIVVESGDGPTGG